MGGNWERMMDMEVVVKRKVAKLAKTWAPVLLLMGLLIAVDSFDSVQGASFLSKMQQQLLSLGFASQQHHLELPPHTTFPTNQNTNGKSSKYWKARHLLHRPSASTNPAPHLRPVPPPHVD